MNTMNALAFGAVLLLAAVASTSGGGSTSQVADNKERFSYSGGGGLTGLNVKQGGFTQVSHSTKEKTVTTEKETRKSKSKKRKGGKVSTQETSKKETNGGKVKNQRGNTQETSRKRKGRGKNKGNEKTEVKQREGNRGRDGDGKGDRKGRKGSTETVINKERSGGRRRSKNKSGKGSTKGSSSKKSGRRDWKMSKCRSGRRQQVIEKLDENESLEYELTTSAESFTIQFCRKREKDCLEIVLSSSGESSIKLDGQDLGDPISDFFYKKGEKFSFTITYTSQSVVVRNSKSGLELVASVDGDELKGFRYCYGTANGGEGDSTFQIREREFSESEISSFEKRYRGKGGRKRGGKRERGNAQSPQERKRGGRKKGDKDSKSNELSGGKKSRGRDKGSKKDRSSKKSGRRDWKMSKCRSGRRQQVIEKLDENESLEYELTTSAESFTIQFCRKREKDCLEIVLSSSGESSIKLDGQDLGDPISDFFYKKGEKFSFTITYTSQRVVVRNSKSGLELVASVDGDELKGFRYCYGTANGGEGDSTFQIREREFSESEISSFEKRYRGKGGRKRGGKRERGNAQSPQERKRGGRKKGDKDSKSNELSGGKKSRGRDWKMSKCRSGRRQQVIEKLDENESLEYELTTSAESFTIQFCRKREKDCLEIVLSSSGESSIKLDGQDLGDPISDFFYKKGEKFSFTITYTSQRVVVRNSKSGLELVASVDGDELKGFRYCYGTANGGEGDSTFQIREREFSESEISSFEKRYRGKGGRKRGGKRERGNTQSPQERKRGGRKKGDKDSKSNELSGGKKSRGRDKGSKKDRSSKKSGRRDWKMSKCRSGRRQQVIEKLDENESLEYELTTSAESFTIQFCRKREKDCLEIVLSSSGESSIKLDGQDLGDPISDFFYKKGEKFSFTITYTSQRVVVRNSKSGLELVASVDGDELKGFRYCYGTANGGEGDSTFQIREREFSESEISSFEKRYRGKGGRKRGGKRERGNTQSPQERKRGGRKKGDKDSKSNELSGGKKSRGRGGEKRERGNTESPQERKRGDRKKGDKDSKSNEKNRGGRRGGSKKDSKSRKGGRNRGRGRWAHRRGKYYRWRTVKGAVKRTRAVSFDERRSAMSVFIKTKATRFVLEFCLSSGGKDCYTASLSSQRDSASFFEYGGQRTGDSQDGAFIRFKRRTRLYVSVSRTKLTIYNDKGDDLSVALPESSVIQDVYMSTSDGDWTKVRFRLRRSGRTLYSSTGPLARGAAFEDIGSKATSFSCLIRTVASAVTFEICFDSQGNDCYTIELSTQPKQTSRILYGGKLVSNEEIGIFITPSKESKIFFRIEKRQLEIWNKEPNNERQLIAKIRGKGRSFNSIWASTSDGEFTELQMVETEAVREFSSTTTLERTSIATQLQFPGQLVLSFALEADKVFMEFRRPDGKSYTIEMGTKAGQPSVIRSGGSNLVDPQDQPFLEFGNDIDPPNQLVIDVFESSVTVSTARGQKMVAPVAEAYLYNHFDIWTVGGGIALAVEEIEDEDSKDSLASKTEIEETEQEIESVEEELKGNNPGVQPVRKRKGKTSGKRRGKTGGRRRGKAKESKSDDDTEPENEPVEEAKGDSPSVQQERKRNGKKGGKRRGKTGDRRRGKAKESKSDDDTEPENEPVEEAKGDSPSVQQERKRNGKKGGKRRGKTGDRRRGKAKESSDDDTEPENEPVEEAKGDSPGIQQERKRKGKIGGKRRGKTGGRIRGKAKESQSDDDTEPENEPVEEAKGDSPSVQQERKRNGKKGGKRRGKTGDRRRGKAKESSDDDTEPVIEPVIQDTLEETKPVNSEVFEELKGNNPGVEVKRTRGDRIIDNQDIEDTTQESSLTPTQVPPTIETIRNTGSTDEPEVKEKVSQDVVEPVVKPFNEEPDKSATLETNVLGVAAFFDQTLDIDRLLQLQFDFSVTINTGFAILLTQGQILRGDYYSIGITEGNVYMVQRCNKETAECNRLFSRKIDPLGEGTGIFTLKIQKILNGNVDPDADGAYSYWFSLLYEGAVVGEQVEVQYPNTFYIRYIGCISYKYVATWNLFSVVSPGSTQRSSAIILRNAEETSSLEVNSFDREVVFSVKAQDFLIIRLYSVGDVVYTILVGDEGNNYVTGSSGTGDKSPDDASRRVEGGVLSLAGKQYYLSWRNGRMKFGETEEDSEAMMNWEIGEISVTKLEFIAAYDSLYLIHTYKYFYVFGDVLQATHDRIRATSLTFFTLRRERGVPYIHLKIKASGTVLIALAKDQELSESDMVLIKMSSRRITLSTCLGCETIYSVPIPKDQAALLDPSSFLEYQITCEGNSLKIFLTGQKEPLLDYGGIDRDAHYGYDGFGGTIGSNYHIKLNQGTIYREEHCLDVNTFLGGGTKLLKIVHSDQMIALFDAEKQLEAELAMEDTKTELRTTRGGEAVQISQSSSCIFHAPYTLVWMDFSGGAIRYGTYDEANRLRSDPCITYDLGDDQEVKYMSFGQQHSSWDVTHHVIEKRIVYKELVSHVQEP
ncbi:uncharacterized protein LOC576141 isoform X3 [Strongylocentrotus purpuratus]|uniref:Uncharacterized protein n=1 Tax=Strongylocentrotus purpuratus TaxID=7668 RepID=A0A7M7N349_STRPU|nr:uncharacterized protein LOC576141 isoform X3 [Strongylocentrotus purpuratus]